MSKLSVVYIIKHGKNVIISKNIVTYSSSCHLKGTWKFYSSFSRKRIHIHYEFPPVYKKKDINVKKKESNETRKKHTCLQDDMHPNMDEE